MYYILFKKYDTRLSDRPYWKKRLRFEFDTIHEARNWINVCCGTGRWWRQSFEATEHEHLGDEDRSARICDKVIYQIRKMRKTQGGE